MATESKGSKSDTGKLADEIGARVKEEKAEASRLAGDAWSATKETGADAARAARQEAEAQGEKLKAQTTGELDAFASAIRAASDKLSEKQPGMVADLMDQAASGLQGMSEALQRKSSSEIVDTIRDFGRRNPMAFIAGSVLTGFALGRFAGSSATHKARQRPQHATRGPATSSGAAGPGASANAMRTPGASSETMRTGG
jgi:hypothetical protein